MERLDALARQTLDTLPINIAVLDDEGTILFTNRSWDDFESSGRGPERDMVGLNYFDATDADADEYAAQAVEGIRSVMRGDREIYRLEYPCHSPDQKRWFMMRATPLPDHEVGAVVVAHINITQRKLAEINARERRLELEHVMARIDGLVQHVMEGVLQASSRDEVEATVADRLVAVDPYVAAWVGRIDLRTDELRASATAGDGVTGDATFSLDLDDPVVRASRANHHRVVQNVASADLGDRHGPVTEGTAGSFAAFPLVFGDSRYGVLVVYADKPDAFDDRELAVLRTLARVASTAINALEGKRVLVSDSVTEVDLEISDEGIFFGDLARELDVRFEHEGTLYQDDGTALMLFVVHGSDPETVIEAARAHDGVTEVVHVSETAEGDVFEFAVSEPPIASVLAARGATTTAIEAEGRSITVTLELPASADPRSVIQQLGERYPSTQLVGRRDRKRPEQTKQELVADIDESLTGRQELALQKAYLGGFFEWPRTISGEDLAESMDISPSTYHQHLRAAERKVLAALYGDA